MEKNWKLLGVASGALLVMLFQWQPPKSVVEESQRIYELRRLPVPVGAEPATAGNRLREAATIDTSMPAQLLTGR